MKKEKLLRAGITAVFILLAVLLVYLVVRQTMPDIIPLLQSGDEAALEAYLSRDMSLSGILYMALLQMVQVPDDPCYCAVTFLDGEYKERDVEVEAWKTVNGSYLDTEHVKFRTLPAVTVASCTFRGPYEKIGEVYAAIAAWIADNGYECSGPMFNIYHVSPHETKNPDEFVTEVCYPVKKK